MATDAIQVIRHPRARRVRLAVDRATGVVRLTLPPRAALAPALKWAEGQQAWIERQRAALPDNVPYQADAEIPFRGHPITIRWDAARRRAPELIEGELWCGGLLDGLDRRIERWLRGEALRLLSADSAEYATRAGVSIASVSLTNARRRWGSCSSDGALRYNWRLVLAPDWVRRATAAHEVAHRVHMDHSPAFHAAVARIFGEDPAPANAWLRRYGPGLHRIGRVEAGLGA